MANIINEGQAMAVIGAVLAERHPALVRKYGCAAGARVVADLELSSIDFIQVLAAIDARLGVQVPYDRLLAGVEPLTDLALGRLARFIAEAAAPAGGEGVAAREAAPVGEGAGAS